VGLEESSMFFFEYSYYYLLSILGLNKNRIMKTAYLLFKRETFSLSTTFSKIIISVFILAFFLTVQSSYAQTAVERYGQLRVQGSHIVDKNGTQVQLRGMSLYWSQWIPKYWNTSTIKWLRDDWCINVIRCPMAVDNGGYATNSAEKNKIIAVVDAAIQNGIYVIIDFHIGTGGNARVNEAKTFFGEMSLKYKDSPNVLYELWNEPGPTDSWLGVIKPYHESVISTIRKNDPDNIIICGTRSWSQNVDEAAANPIAGANITYTLHFYAATHKQWLRDRAQAAMNSGIALFVTEYGTCEASGNGFLDQTETNAWWSFLETNKVGHCNWSIADISETSAALSPNASANGGWAPGSLKPSGQFVRNYLVSKCGVVTTNIPPTVSISEPLNNASFTAPASVTINATAADANGTVSTVQFFNGTTLLGSDATSPYSFVWTAVAAGTYSITAMATDNAGAITTSTAVGITVTAVTTNTPPTVSISAPLNNVSFAAPASVSINATAADANGTVSAVQFFNGTTLLGSDATSPYSFTWINVAAGTYSITAKATDNAGAITTSTAVSITVTAVTPPPSGDIIGSACGAKNTTASFELAPTNKTNATTISWWFTGSSQSVTPVAGDPTKVIINYGASFTGGDVCAGVNYSAAPWFKQYCKTLTICGARMDVSFATENTVESQGLIIAPNPSSNYFLVTVPESVQSFAVVNDLGATVQTGNNIEGGTAITLGEQFPTGLYTLFIHYSSGREEAKRIQKLK
jgi:aryl-phospho-beta-D-glucosidase BglC (GH1 family)